MSDCHRIFGFIIIIDMKKYCLGFMFNEKHTDVLLINKERPEWQKGLINGIGGKLEEGENSISAMVREFREETGIDSNESDWRYVVTMYRYDWEVDVYTTTSDMIFYAQDKTDESTVVLPLGELDGFPLISNLYWLLPMCLDKVDYNIKRVGHI